jgi:hypothetical protein
MTDDSSSSKWQAGRGWYRGRRHGAGPKLTDRTAPRMVRMKERAKYRHRITNEMIRQRRDDTTSH